jgi:hypothetical protein
VGGVGENAQGRLEGMRKVASLRAGALDDLAVLRQDAY